MKNLPPLRHFVYVLGTVNVVMAVVLVGVALAFNEGVNIVAIVCVFLVANIISALTVIRQA